MSYNKTSNTSKYNTTDSSSSSSSPSSSGRSTPEQNYDELSIPIVSTTQQSKMKNVFANDGSFLEMFKKYQQKQTQIDNKKDDNETAVSSSTSNKNTSSTSSSTAAPILPMIGKRRGGKILPTGRVKKIKNDDDDDGTYENVRKPKDAWSVYMTEVQKYKETVCQSDDNSRPLVK